MKLVCLTMKQKHKIFPQQTFPKKLLEFHQAISNKQRVFGEQRFHLLKKLKL